MNLEDSIKTLVSQWEDRLNSGKQSKEYKEALSECSYELKTTMSMSLMARSSIIQPQKSSIEAEIDAQLALLESYEPNV